MREDKGNIGNDDDFGIVCYLIGISNVMVIYVTSCMIQELLTLMHNEVGYPIDKAD